MADYGQLYREAERFRRALLRREREAASDLVRYYGEIWRVLNQKIQALVTAYYADPEPSQNWLFRYDRLAALRAQVDEQIRAFSQYAENRIKAEQLYLIDQAQRHSEQLVRLGLVRAPDGFRLNFNRLAVDAITDLVGMLQSGSSLRSLLNELPGDAGQSVADGLIRGVALGLNPRAVAREIRQALGGNLVRALRIARTEQLRAYREATRRSYQANEHVIKGWIWVSARNERTCAACWAKHGSKHSLDEPMDEHPNGRCSKVPWLKTWEELGFSGIAEGSGPVESGAVLFARMPAEKQIKILGPAKYMAYREGRLSLSDLVGRKVSPTWGVTHYERSLKEVGLDKAELLKEFRDRQAN
ncbi:MAG: phage minor head protein [Anaerolineales bacterium]|nr:phage minor head protein [Anaerolineales bacterium]